MVVILMGVAGAGKTTVGRALAAALGWTFRDTDELHAIEAVAKMRRGDALSEDDRWPWLRRVRDVIADAVARGEPAVIACSALRESYRAFLADGLEASVRFVYLDAPRALLASRLAARTGHFAKADLLDTQLSTLEPPAHALTLNAGTPVPELVAAIRAHLNL